MDVASPDPGAVVKRFRDRMSLPPRAPALAGPGVRLVGGSFCQLRATRGIRWTYVLGDGATVSVYQLERPAGLALPGPGPFARLGAADRPGLVLWGDARHVYALADLPLPEIERLASRL